jgi:lipopolysaccharide export system permease protein
MRLSRTLSLYVLREVGQYAAIGLAAVGSVLLTQNLLRQLENLSGAGLTPMDLVSVTGCLLALLGSYAIPVAFLFGVLVAVGRLSADSEITAMRALGVSLLQFMAPVLVVSLLVSAATAALLFDVEPGARRQLRAVVGEIASRGGIIEPGRFNHLDRRGERLLFAEDRDERNRLSGVLITDRTNPENPFTVVAEYGTFLFDTETATASLQLEDGDIHFELERPGDDDYQRIAFDRFDYAFDMSAMFGAGFDRIRPREMSMREVREVLAHFNEHDRPPDVVRVRTREHYDIQLHRRLALPMAPMLFAVVGVPLGLRRTRGARSFGALVCVALVFGYYTLLSAGVYLAENLVVPAALGLWLPNLIFVAVAVVLLLRARRAEI